MKRVSIRFAIIAFFLALIIIAIVVLLLSPPASPSGSGIKHPFSVSVEKVEITEEVGQIIVDNRLELTGSLDRRLRIVVSIENNTQDEFQDVWFQLSLNSEVKPFIASQIITFESTPKSITTKEKVAQNSNTDNLLISGFIHNWSMLLTNGAELDEYYGKKPDEIYDALKSVTVTLYWDGGSQTETIPCTLSTNIE